MHDSVRSANSIGEVTIHLLDPASGRPVKSWEFIGKERITIGRSPEQDVAMSDPYVSRHHAELTRRDGQWYLVSHGRNGVVVANKMVMDHKVGNEISFRLGVEGPLLRFCAKSEQVEAMATISFDSQSEPMFQLDEIKIQQEVTEIAEGDYFQRLQQRAKQMRLQRGAES
jgi:hypothetical protein